MARLQAYEEGCIVKAQPMLPQIVQEQYEELAVQSNLILQIIEKLHAISSQGDTTAVDNTKDTRPSDIVGNQYAILSQLKGNNSNLRQAFEHLSQIV